MAASPIHCIYTMPRAQARSTAYLQGGGPQGALPPCKYAVDLFCGRPKIQEAKKKKIPSGEAPGAPEEAPGKSLEKQRRPTKWPQARFNAFLQGAVAPSIKGQKIPKKFLSWTPFRKKPFPKSRWIERSNHCILRVFSECVDRIHRKSQVAMTVTEIDRGPPQSRRTEFRRRGPWGGPLCAVWKQ